MRVEAKAIALAALGHRFAEPFLRPFGRGLACIVTLHRFADAELGVRGHPASALRAQLAFLRRNRYRLLPLLDLVEGVRHGTLDPSRAVAFTVDDGYADFQRVAAPVFAEFDCPVTVFLATGFVDGGAWLWWDEVEHVLTTTRARTAEVVLGGRVLRYELGHRDARRAAAHDLGERLERVPDAVRRFTIEWLGTRLGVAPPATPPPHFAAMRWDEVRSLAREGGVHFGPHSVNHPILAQLDDHASANEIEVSWRRLREETDAAIPVFAIPNGQPYAFGPRELRTVQRLGMCAVVTTTQDYIDRGQLASHDPGQTLALPRFACPTGHAHFVQIATGLERAKRAVRAALGPVAAPIT